MPTCPAKPVDEGMNYLFGAFLAKMEKGPGPSRTPTQSTRQNGGRETRRSGYHFSVHLTTDYIHPAPRGGRCRVRVWLPNEERDAPVVVCSELPTNEGTSVTNAAEQLAVRLAATLANSGGFYI
jgi:hypothetical protein